MKVHNLVIGASEMDKFHIRYTTLQVCDDDDIKNTRTI
jgi:hypothetical protein